jgi:hypothetical protein
MKPTALPVPTLNSGSVYRLDLGRMVNKFLPTKLTLAFLTTLVLDNQDEGIPYDKETSRIFQNAALVT